MLTYSRRSCLNLSWIILTTWIIVFFLCIQACLQCKRKAAAWGRSSPQDIGYDPRLNYWIWSSVKIAGTSMSLYWTSDASGMQCVTQQHFLLVWEEMIYWGNHKIKVKSMCTWVTGQSCMLLGAIFVHTSNSEAHGARKPSGASASFELIAWNPANKNIQPFAVFVEWKNWNAGWVVWLPSQSFWLACSPHPVSRKRRRTRRRRWST